MTESFDSIKAVRKRPGMYVGDTRDGTGLHALVYEIVGNAINEAAAGYVTRISAILNPDGSCTVSDDGRGIPVERHPYLAMSAAEVILTSLHAAGSLGLGPCRGVGLCVVNALSEWLELRIWRDGREHRVRFVDGIPEAPVRAIGSSNGLRGTEVTFKPSRAFFDTVEFDTAALDRRLNEFSVQYGVAIDFSDNRSGQE